jgi:hypothetical protein
MAKKKKKKSGKKKPGHRKSPKRSKSAKRKYKGSALHKYNMKRSKGGKRKKNYGKKKSRGGKSKHKRYAAMKAAARVDWSAIAHAAQKSKQRRAAAHAGFGGPPRAKHANTAYLARLRKKHKAGGSKASGLPAWF